MATLADPITGEVFRYWTRAELGLAAPTRRTTLAPSKIQASVLHHAVTGTAPAGSIWRGVQSFHQRSKGWSDIAYTDGVSDDGEFFAGRGLFVAGGHTEGWNSRAHALCYIGNSDQDAVSEKARRAILAWLRHVDEQVRRPLPVYLHRELGTTACPGASIARWASAGFPLGRDAPLPPLPPLPIPDQEDIMAGEAQAILEALDQIRHEHHLGVMKITGDEFRREDFASAELTSLKDVVAEVNAGTLTAVVNLLEEIRGELADPDTGSAVTADQLLDALRARLEA